MPRLIGSMAALLGLVPLVWLLRSAPQDRRYWWMAVGFAVSFVADLIARFSAPVFVSQLYPVTQSALFVLVLAQRKYVEWIIGGLLACAAASVALRDAQGLDVLLHVIAWGTVAALAMAAPYRLRVALVTYFAGGAVLWLAYVASPGWTTWLAYQTTRLLGVVLWCVAASKANPRVEATPE